MTMRYAHLAPGAKRDAVHLLAGLTNSKNDDVIPESFLENSAKAVNS